MRKEALYAAVIALCACGKQEQTAKPVAAKHSKAAIIQDDGPLFSLDSAEPEIPALPDQTQAHPGPDDALKADRAGLTVGTMRKSVRIEWVSETLADGGSRLWARKAVVDYRMTIAVFVSSNFKDGTCPYRVTWDHELSHARAYVSMFAASKVHLLAALEHSQEQEPSLPTRDSPVTLKAEEVADFERRLGEKLRAVVEDQERVLDALMADHKRDRDSPEMYRQDTEKCPADDWRAGRSS